MSLSSGNTRNFAATNDTDDWRITQALAVALLNKIFDPLKHAKEELKRRNMDIGDTFGWHCGDMRRLDHVSTDVENRAWSLEMLQHRSRQDGLGQFESMCYMSTYETIHKLDKFPDQFPVNANPKAIHYFAPSPKYLRGSYHQAVKIHTDLSLSFQDIRKFLLNNNNENLKKYNLKLSQLIDDRDYISDKNGYCYTIHDPRIIQELAAIAKKLGLKLPSPLPETKEPRASCVMIVSASELSSTNLVPLVPQQAERVKPLEKKREEHWCYRFFRPVTGLFSVSAEQKSEKNGLLKMNLN
ncbi:MAG: hypothetical protein ABI597_01845 [Gammaproteobacteria bacterium]